jgi:hypothetical protein
MGNTKYALKVVRLIAAVALTSGCGANTDTPSDTTADQPTPSAGQSEIFRFVRTVQVTPDAANVNFGDGALGYVHYIPATNRLVVILGVTLRTPVTLTYSSQECGVKAFAYKEYTTDMQATGNYGFISCSGPDVTSQVVGNDLYLASMAGSPEWMGWRLEKFDAVTWQRTASVDIPLNDPVERSDGPTIAFINGRIVVSGEYFPDGTPDGPLGRGSHHHFFSADLQPLGKKILVAPAYPAHCPEVSMIQEAGGDILIFASDTYMGDLFMLRLDNAFFPTGAATDGRLCYIAYTDTSRRSAQWRYRNIGLAAFDADWNVLQDTAVTDFINTSDTYVDGESPWVQLHGNRLYVSYLKTTFDPVTGRLRDNQAYVNIYELI